MNPNVYFVLLLAVGFSSQTTEFEIDLKNLQTVKMKDGKTLLDCPDNCINKEEPACNCIMIEECKNNNVLTCIKKGLELLFPGTNTTEDLTEELTHLMKHHPNEKRGNTSELQKLVSPKIFLNFILTFYQKLETLEAYRLRKVTPRLKRSLST